MKGTARAAAAEFYELYFARKFELSWDLLAAEARHHISRSTWVKVHNSCLPSNAGTTATIKSVTVFGDTAIVTETVKTASRQREIETVFNFANGSWGYSPGDLSIYQHGSVARDIAAAKAAGFCSGQTNSIL